MNWVVCFFDCCGQEILDYRKYVKDKSRSEIIECAKLLEDELYLIDDTVDFYQFREACTIKDEDSPSFLPKNLQELCG